MNVFCQKLISNVSYRILDRNGASCSNNRRLSYYVNKIRTFEWMKNDDSALQAEFKRAHFLVFYNKQPLLKRSKDSSRLTLAWIEHDRNEKYKGVFGLEY